MEDFVDEGEKNFRPEKRHVQDEIDSTDSCPRKLMTTPRSRGKTPEGGKTASMTRSDKVSLDEISVSETMSSNRTPAEKRDTRKTKSSDRTLVEERSTSKTEPSNRTLLEKKKSKESRSSSKTPLEEKSTRKTRSSHISLELEKRDTKTRSFNKLPEEDRNTIKTDLLKKSSIQEKRSSKTRLPNRSLAQEGRNTRMRFSSITSEPKLNVSKSLSSIRTPLQENIASKTGTSDRPLVHCKSGSKTKLSENTPLNGGIVRASKAPPSYSLTAKENDSQDTELKMAVKEAEFKERGSRTVIRGQNREQHQGGSYPKDTKKNHPADRTSSSLQKECLFRKSEDSEVKSSDSLFSGVDKGTQVEIEKVKMRRSTICLGNMSSHSIGGRQSLSATFIFEDRISKIGERLPWASKLGKLINISIREALRRLETHLPGNECVTDLRRDLLTKFENLPGEIAIKIADYPKDLEAASQNTSSYAEKVQASGNKIAAYKKRTKELEEEYRNWKILMKERKLACQFAQMNYREAKSGETEIEDDQINQLTSAQRNILTSCPNYDHYMQEIQMLRERAILVSQEVRLRTNTVSNLITSSSLLADSCYASLEKLSLGDLKKHSVKTCLTSLIQKSHTGITKVCDKQFVSLATQTS